PPAAGRAHRSLYQRDLHVYHGRGFFQLPALAPAGRGRLWASDIRHRVDVVLGFSTACDGPDKRRLHHAQAFSLVCRDRLLSGGRESAGVPAVESPAAGFCKSAAGIQLDLRTKGDVTVTTTDAAAARRHGMMALAVLVGLASLSLAGCGGNSLPSIQSFFGSSSDGPQAAATPAVAQAPLSTVAINSIVGPPDALG